MFIYGVYFPYFMMKQIEDLETLLSQISSDRGRAFAIKLLVRKVDIPQTQIDYAINFYEKSGQFLDAAEVAKEVGMTERAVDNYENAGRFEDAANVAKQVGMTERARAYQTLADLIKG